jgi:DNA repair protein RadD
LIWHDVSRVDYKLHRKEGKPDSMRVDYYDGLLRCASEWVCFDHIGYARQKAINWWCKRTLNDLPSGVEGVLKWLSNNSIAQPTRIATRRNGKFTEVKEYEFDRIERHQDTLEATANAD